MSDPAPRGRPAAAEANPAPETLEGWYVLHDGYDMDWPAWRRLSADQRQQLAAGLSAWLTARAPEGGGSACYRLLGQKGDLLFLHYRTDLAALAAVSRNLKELPIADFLLPRVGYVSVVEASLYEATGRAHGLLARRGLRHGMDGFEAALAAEMAAQKQHLEERVRKPIPAGSHICFYPMSKRRGEQVNWYDMPLDERRALMRGHGEIGARYVDRLTQVISGSVGLDDWEWAVDLHADDPLLFKKLIYEMRFDPASSRYALFGSFWIGLATDGAALERHLHLGG